MNSRSRIAVLAFAVGLLVAVAGCGSWGKHSPTAPFPTDRDTCYTCPPDTCPTCPPDTCKTCPKDTSMACYSLPGKGDKIHEAQSHVDAVQFTVANPVNNVSYTFTVSYTEGKSKNNQVLVGLLINVANQLDVTPMISDDSGYPGIPDPAGFNGTLPRTIRISNLPPGTYLLRIQMDTPNTFKPGESQTVVGPGALQVCQQK
ncbi:MAG: hypothetical protein V1907_00765 [Candidatus Kerfeldbacteria bacterium]